MNILTIALLTLLASCTLSCLVSTKMTYLLFSSFTNLNLKYTQDELTERRNFFHKIKIFSISIFYLSFTTSKLILCLLFLFTIVIQNLGNLGKLNTSIQKKTTLMQFFLILIFFILYLNIG